MSENVREIILGGVRPKGLTINLRALGFVGTVSDEARAEIERAERRAARVLCGESWNLPDAETVEITTTFGLIAEIRQALEGAKP